MNQENIDIDERLFRALDTLRDYDLDIPVNLIDHTPDDGTQIGEMALLVKDRIGEMIAEMTSASVERLNDFYVALGGKELSEQQIGLARLFFSAEIALSMVQSQVECFGTPLTKGNPDAVSDLKKALFEGLYEEEG